MRFTDTFIKRPVLALAISFLILLVGLQAFKGMQVREYPEMTNTVITVTTSYYGANGDLIQGFITQPLEQAIAQADNVDYMTSQSTQNMSIITVYMKLNTDPNSALADILAQVNSVQSVLPTESEDPVIALMASGGTSLMYISFTSDELNSSQITDYLERVVRPQLFTVQGVAGVELYGGIQFALRIWLDPEKMAAFNLTAGEVLNVLQANNIQSAPGQVTGAFILYNAEADTQVKDAAELEDMVIATRDNFVIRLSSIAEVTLEKSRDVYRAMANGKNTVIVAIDPSPTANPLEVTAEVNQMLPSLEASLPSNINMNLLYDATLAIEESISEVLKTIIEAAIIVLLVIVLFMGSFRAVIIPIVTIPLSLIGVAILMTMLNFSVNLMTLLAMVLAIGLVVDDAIVVVENVDRHIKLGKKPLHAAVIGTREIAMPVVATTVALIAVYAPIAFMGGLTGSLFKEFSLTLAGSVFVSSIVALTLSPMMCAYMLKPNTTKVTKFEAFVESYLSWLDKYYQKMLNAVMQKRLVVMIFAVISFASMPILFSFIPSELAPAEDRGVFMVFGKAPSTANLDYIENTMRATGDLVDDTPELNSWLAFSGMPSSNQAMGVFVMKTWGQRERSQKEVLAEVSQKIKDVPQMALSAFGMPELPGASSGMPIQFIITTPNNFESLFDVASNIFANVQKSPLFVYSEMDLAYDSATIKIHIDRNKAGSYGITMQDISMTLSTMMSDGYINRIGLNGRSYEVITQVKRTQRLNPEALNSYYVRSQAGDAVPLSELITIDIVGQPRSLPHFNQLNSVTIGAVNAPTTPMGDAIEFLESQAKENLPNGYFYDFMGEARQFVTEGNALMGAFVLALIIIFLVLASQFESIRDPIVILLSVPLGISGALIFMAWGLTTMNIYAQIGLVTLIGLMAKHGILICEVAKEEQLNNGASKTEAVMVAAKTRLRAILMTTISMVAGLVPLLVATGAGAQSRFSLGIVIVAGLSIGTIFTLFVLPVIYSYIASNHKPLVDTNKF